MEKQWPILWYCQDHWKAHLITTRHYYQWYIPFDRKTCKDNKKETKGPAPKKLKTMTEDDYMGVSQTDIPPEDLDDNDNNNNNDNNDDNNNNNNNNDSPVPSWLKNNMQEGLSKGALKLRPGPLIDPL